MKTLALLAFVIALTLSGCAGSTGTSGLSPAQQASLDKLGATITDDLTVLAQAENAKLLQKIAPAQAGLAK